MKRKPLTREAATPDQVRCWNALSDLVRGDHHIRGNVYACGTGISVFRHGEFATFDGSELTRLVLIAHRDSVRFAISGGGFGRMEITVHPRKAQKETVLRFSERHPTLHDLVASAIEMNAGLECDHGEAGPP